MPEKQNFLITVFATAKEPKLRLALAANIARALQAICPGKVTHVHPDESKLVLLVQGEYSAIVKALNAACQQYDDSWLLAQVGTPCAASGLAKADGWLRSHSQASAR